MGGRRPAGKSFHVRIQAENSLRTAFSGADSIVRKFKKTFTKSQHKEIFADTGFPQKARNRDRKALFRMPGATTRQAPSVHRACSVRPDCLRGAGRMLVRSGQNACAERAECLCGVARNLVPTSQKGCRLLQSGFLRPQREHFPPPETVFSSLSNVRISLSRCLATDYSFSLPFFRASRTEGRKNEISRAGKVKVSECKGKKSQTARPR